MTMPNGALDALADTRTAHTCASWNARRHQLAAESYEVAGVVHVGPRGDELGPRLQEMWLVEAGQLLNDLCIAVQGLAAGQVLAFEQQVHEAVHDAAMAALPPVEALPSDAAAALDAHREDDSGDLPAVSA